MFFFLFPKKNIFRPRFTGFFLYPPPPPKKKGREMVARRALACPVCVCVCRLDAGNEGGGTLLRTTRCHGDREQEAARRNGAPQKGAAAGGEKKTPKSPQKKRQKETNAGDIIGAIFFVATFSLFGRFFVFVSVFRFVSKTSDGTSSPRHQNSVKLGNEGRRR